MTISSKKSSGSAVDEDRISQLSEEIIHLILHLLYNPREAARTSILSRSWLHLWQIYPVVQFWYSKRNPIDKFQSFANATSMRLLRMREERGASSSPLDTFRILFKTPSDDKENLVLEELLSLASLLPTNDDDRRSPLQIYLHCNPTPTRLNYSTYYRVPDGALLNCRRTKSLSLSLLEVAT
ncbi:unnamed protein product [Linum tenue]|uniref:F-box domain-containing protein n=1 Tax=Linum tenue TaxID=586396 RepID=A0AAV0NMC1_9ROSI|nr:unnamed protein product [Linum tenue]